MIRLNGKVLTREMIETNDIGFDERVVFMALHTLNGIKCVPEIYYITNTSILFKFRNDEGIMELEFFGYCNVNVFKISKNGMLDYTIEYGIDKVRKLIESWVS